MRQYLERWAERETALSACLDGRWSRALVVPAHREQAALLDGFDAAARAAPGRTLCIVVVNADVDIDAQGAQENAELVEGLRARVGSGEEISRTPLAWLGGTSSLDVLVVDRTSHGHRLPKKQGVGLARRIGCDLATGLFARGRIETPFVFCTDADVTLPADYFTRIREADPRAAACVYPFWHEPSGDAAIDRATALYELEVRWYVLGLGRAGSPYAFHSVGSTLAVRYEAYAAVRGFPRRLAGEDFHLLSKLAKVGPIERLPGAALCIASRRSDRAPFGTGRAVKRLERSELRVYDPRAFGALGVWLRALDAFAEHRDPNRVRFDTDGVIEAESSQAAAATARALEHERHRLALPDVLSAASRASPGPELRRRLHSWFDGLRTLQLLHALRDRALPDRAWPDALTSSAWVPAGFGDADIDAARHALAEAEMGLARQVGPSLF